MNQLYFGDNLQVLRESLADASVDLVYLDPPFNSKRDYNLLFKSPKGQKSEAQVEAFKDSWHWGEQAEREFDELLHQANTDVAEMMKALRAFLGQNDIMAYLTMMANRLLEMHRVLKPTGSLYLHCDPTASHYLKLVLDGVFGKLLFRNEIVWKRAFTVKGNFGQGSKHFGQNTDTVFFYSKTDEYNFNPQFSPYSEEYVTEFFRYAESDGRRYRLISMIGPGGAAKGNPQYEFMGVTKYWRYSEVKMHELHASGMIVQTKPGTVPQRKQYLDQGRGVGCQSLWDDIPALSFSSKERLGYPTQKPVALLERIISASSNEGDVVLDPFCGCGTAVHAAQKLKRKWIGIDITHLAISLIEKRLKDAFGAKCKFEVQGTPGDLEAARDLAARDKYQFQWWAVSLVEAQPYQGKKKGADTGIDGLKFFYDLTDEDARKIVVSVKGGGLKADDIRALNHVREREKAEIAILISLNEPTAKMRADAASAGIYHGGADGKTPYPRVQLLTIEGLLSGQHRAEHPDYVKNVNFKKAKRETNKPTHKTLFDEAD